MPRSAPIAVPPSAPCEAPRAYVAAPRAYAAPREAERYEDAGGADPVRLVRVSELGANMVIDDYRAELSEALGGVRRGGTIVLAGSGGAGKSTLAAELSAAVAEATQGFAYWLDRDQLASDLIVATFERTNSPTNRVLTPEARDPREPGFRPLTWPVALAQVPRDAAVLVVDSLETWADSYAQQVEIARQTMTHGARLKVLIAGVNAKGRVEGLGSLKRACDAVVVVRPAHFFVEKCRWLPNCPKHVHRAPAEDDDEAGQDDGADEAGEGLEDRATTGARFRFVV